MNKHQYKDPKWLQKQNLKIYYVTSSLGSVTFRFVYDFTISIFPFLKEQDFRLALENQ